MYIYQQLCFFQLIRKKIYVTNKSKNNVTGLLYAYHRQS